MSAAAVASNAAGWCSKVLLSSDSCRAHCSCWMSERAASRGGGRDGSKGVGDDYLRCPCSSRLRADAAVSTHELSHT